jgi:hypothetical protein
MRKTLVLVLALIVAAFCLPSNTHADPTIVNDLAFIDNRPADDIFGQPGLRLQLDVNVTDTNGQSALTGPGAGTKATSSNAGFPSSQPVTVPVNSFFGLLGVEFTANLLLPGGSASFPNVTGTYNYTVTNTTAQTASVTSHNLDKPEVIPIPTGLGTNNNSTTPIFSFTDPNPTPGISGLARRYDFFIHDGVTHAAIYEFAVATGQLSLTPSFTVPTGLLVPGHPYFLAAASVDFDTTEPSSSININWEGRSREFLAFTPTAVPEPTSLLLVGSCLTMLTGVAWRQLRRK